MTVRLEKLIDDKKRGGDGNHGNHGSHGGHGGRGTYDILGSCKLKGRLLGVTLPNMTPTTPTTTSIIQSKT